VFGFVQIRGKAAEERLSDSGGGDWTRYDIKIDTVVYARQYNRGLFFMAIQALIRSTPEQIMEMFPPSESHTFEHHCQIKNHILGELPI